MGISPDFRPVLRRGTAWCLSSVLLISPLWAAEESVSEPSYDVFYEARVRSDCLARVGIRVARNDNLLARLRIRIEKGQQFDFEGSGRIDTESDHVTWSIPPGEARLEYWVNLNHRRASKGYDARCTDSWAMFRGEDLYPPMLAASPDKIPLSHSKAILRLHVPEGWSLVTTFKNNGDGSSVIEQPHRYFDRPTGWIITGSLGVTRERISGISVVIASPRGEGLRRLDMLALLRWTLPKLKKMLPDLPPRLLIVGAGDPMWRGAISGPDSLYIHADRPLITFDGTSPLLHELMHVVTHARSGEDGDWIVEGMAEYYGLQLLRRSRTISKRRYERTLARLAKRGREAPALRVAVAKGATTARAVDMLHRLDTLLREKSQGASSLDDVVRVLSQERKPVTTERFQRIAEQTAGFGLDDFFSEYVKD